MVLYAVKKHTQHIKH